MSFLTPLKLNDDDWLDTCPCCGGNNLHQTDVSIFNPDAARTDWYVGGVKHTSMTRVTHVTADGMVTTARVDAEQNSNPSPSGSNGMYVEFYCEACEGKPTLAIFQHKGTTFIGWK